MNADSCNICDIAVWFGLCCLSLTITAAFTQARREHSRRHVVSALTQLRSPRISGKCPQEDRLDDDCSEFSAVDNPPHTHTYTHLSASLLALPPKDTGSSLQIHRPVNEYTDGRKRRGSLLQELKRNAQLSCLSCTVHLDWTPHPNQFPIKRFRNLKRERKRENYHRSMLSCDVKTKHPHALVGCSI